LIVGRGGEPAAHAVLALPVFYVSAGFTRTDRFTVGDRPGQALEIRLD
jgi:hypothetical protein